MFAPSLISQNSSVALAAAGVRGGVVVVDGVVIGLRGLLLIGSCLGEDHQEA
ncbi:MAG: hypothetical protein R3B40_15420 [Polyangiales bacterium]|nr:hypothetical protein [Myxococcales bacterium]